MLVRYIAAGIKDNGEIIPQNIFFRHMLDILPCDTAKNCKFLEMAPVSRRVASIAEHKPARRASLA